jgi:hypothetical protein
MTAYRFSLQKALDLRLKQLEKEEAEFKRQTAALADLDRLRAHLQTAKLQEETMVRDKKILSGYDLAVLAAFRFMVEKRDQEIAARIVEAKKQLDQQQAVMLEARQRCRLLERLKERGLEEWQAARDKELEEMAAESFLAQWSKA